MADFKLIVGVNPEASLREFQKGIKGVIEEVNKEPFGIKVKISDDSLKEIHNTINNLRNKIKDVVIKGVGSGSLSATKSASNTSSDKTKISESTKEYNANTKAVQAATAASKTRAKQASDTAKQVSTEAQKVKELASANAQAAKQQADVTSQGDLYTKTLQHITNMMHALESTSNLKTTSLYSDLQNQLGRLNTLKSDFDASNDPNKLTAYTTGLNDLNKELERSDRDFNALMSVMKMASNAVGNNTIVTKSMTQAKKEYADIMSQIEGQITRLNSIDGGATSNAMTSLKALQTEMNALANAGAKGNGGFTMASAKEFIASADGYRAKITEVTSAINELADAQAKSDKAMSVKASADNKYTDIGIKVDALKEKILSLKNADTEGLLGRLNAYKDAIDQAYNTKRPVGFLSVVKQQSGAFKLLKADVDALTKSQREEEAEASKISAAYGTYRQTVDRATSMLRDYSGAERSSNQQRRDAYNEIKQIIISLNELADTYDNGQKDPKAFANEVRELNSRLTEQKTTLTQTGGAFKSWLNQFKDIGHIVSYWVTPMRLMMQMVSTIKKMASATIELNDAMTQMQIVTKASDAEMKRFGDTAMAAAKRTSTSATDIINSATTYARLGYTEEESTKLAEYTAMIQKVGDIDTQDAQDAVTAIVKAFNVAPNEIEDIMDKIVTVGNNFPISVSQIAEGMNNASSTLAAGNNTFEQSLALLTAANTTVQNASKAATGLRTITARIRNTKTDLEELGEDMTESKYEELVSALTDAGVALTNINNEYRSTYDIMSDIASKWENMTDERKSALVTALAGTRQQDIFYSIINQFKEASKAYDEMANSASGALDKAFGTYQKSATSNIEQLKISFQEFSKNLLSSEIISTIVKIGNGLLTIVNVLQKVHLLLPLIASSISIIKGIGAAKSIAGITAGLLAEKKATSALAVSVSQLTAREKQRLVTNIENAVATGRLTAEEGKQILSALGLAAADKTLSAANKGVAISFKELMASIPVWGWISLGISVVIEAISLFSSKLDTTVEDIKDVEGELNSLQSEIQQIADNYRDLSQSANDVIPRFVELAGGVNDLGQNVSLTDEEYKEFLSLNNKIAEMFPQLNMGMDDSGNAMLALSFSADTLRDSLEKLLETQRQQANADIVAKLPGELQAVKDVVDSYNTSISDLQSTIDERSSGSKTFRVINSTAGTATVQKELKAYFDFIQDLRNKGIDVTTNVDTNYISDLTTYSASWDTQSDAFKNMIAGYEKQINNFEEHIKSKWKSVNAGISALLQTDYMYSDSSKMSEQMQYVARTMLSGLDFANLGLIGEDGEATKDKIYAYIQKYILNPIYNAPSDIKATIEDAIKQFESGDMTQDEFASTMKNAFEDLLKTITDGDVLETFKQNFINGFNSIGMAGTNFDTVVNNIIKSWFHLTDTVSDSASTFDIKKFTDKFSETKTAYDILQKAQNEMISNGSVSKDTIDAMSKATDKYLDYLYEENGLIKLNTEAWKEYADTDINAAEQKKNELETEIKNLEDKLSGTALNHRKEMLEFSKGYLTLLTNGAFHELSDEDRAYAIFQYKKAISELTTEIERLNKEAKNDDDVKKLEELQKEYEDILVVIEAYNNLLDKGGDTSHLISDISALDSGFQQLGKIYKDVKDKGAFDFSALIDESFMERFGWLGTAYENFIDTISKSPTDIKACQNAFNSLTTEWITQSGVLQNVTEDTKDLTVAYLKQNGVANAAAVVDSALALQKERLQLETQNVTKKSVPEIQALYAEAAAGSAAKQALAQLLLEKRLQDLTHINTSSDIDELISLAKAAGATTAVIEGLINAKQRLASGDELSYTIAGLKQQIKDLEWSGSGSSKEAKKLRLQLQAAEAQLSKQQLENVSNNLDFYNFDPSKININYSGLTDPSSNKGNGKDTDNWFTRQYKEHQHMLKMEQESEKKYLEWLNDAYQRAYKEGIITKEDSYKYAEEVFTGLRNLFKDEISDLEHEISMREAIGEDAKAIDAIYKQIIDKIEAQIAKARHDGLKDEDSYMQELQKMWQSAVNNRIKLQEEAEKGAKDSAKNLTDIRVNMLKQEIEDERDANKKKLDDLKKFYDKQKELLQDAYDEDKYLEEQAEKRKAVYEIESQLRQLELDDSAWAQKKKLELEQELADRRKELDDFERDHALETAQDWLDEMYEAQEDQYNKEDELLEEKLNDKKALYEQALEDIRNGTAQLYEDMIAWNDKYGDGITDTIKNAWEEAYKALLTYKELFDSLYDNINLENATGYQPEATWGNLTASGQGNMAGNTYVNNKQGGSGSLPLGDIDGDGIVTAADSHMALAAAVQKIQLTPEQIIRGDTDGDGIITAADAGNILKIAVGKPYASGTTSASTGVHRIDENGDETIFQSKDGNKYKLFAGGEKVLNAKASNFLYNFANGGTEVLKNIVGSAVRNGIYNLIAKAGGGVEIHTGDIIIEGNADKATISEIRRAQRDQVDNILKSFSKLKA